MRNFKKATERKTPEPDLLLRAVRMVKIKHIKTSGVAALFNFSYVKTMADEDVYGESEFSTARTGYVPGKVALP